MLAGCTSQTTSPDGISPSVWQRWQQDRSYYALVEIIDVKINPWANPATKTKVLELLGPSIEHPGTSDDVWVYPSVREVPYGSYALIRFDDKDKVKAIEWLSE